MLVFRFLSLALLISIYCLALPRRICANEVSATWNGGTGNWSVATDWNPATVPNNGGGTTYSVTITAAGSVVTMDLSNDAIDNLTLGSPSTLNIETGDTLSLTSGASSNSGTINNYGTLKNNFTGSRPGPTLTNTGTVNNYGDFEIQVTPAAVVNSGILNNYGTLNNWAGVGLTNNGVIYNSGTLVDRVCSCGDGNLYNNGLIINAGVIDNQEEDVLSNSGTIINYGSISNSNRWLNSGTIINSGTISMSDFNRGNLTNNGVFINRGTVNLRGNNFSAINNSGIFTNSGAVAITGSNLFTTSTNYTQTAGSTLVNGTLTATNDAIVNIRGGTLGGTGTINGNVLMSGTMVPAGTTTPGDSPGTLTIDGNYEQTSAGMFDELMSPLDQALLDVNGDVTLDPGSRLDITLLDGFDPLGQTFDIMDFSSLTGTFANGSSFWGDGYLWDILYGPHEIDVTAVRAPEPNSLLLLLIGLVALALWAYREKAKRQRIA